MDEIERLALRPDERRVVGVLAEKGLTTPEQYPLTLKALLTGCNQKSNRDPITHFDEDDVLRAIDSLRTKGLVTVVIPSTGRTERYRQELGSKLELSAQKLAVLTELLLRGPQTEGELRGRAGRMRPIADLTTLRGLFDELRRHDPPLAARLTPEGVGRGVRITHDLYLNEELGTLMAAEIERPEVRPAQGSPASGLREALEQVERRLAGLEGRVAALEGRSPGEE